MKVVSIPSQLGSLLLAQASRTSDAHRRGLNTLTVGQPLVGDGPGGDEYADPESQYPHSWAASCWEPNTSAIYTPPSLNTLTVGQPLVGGRRPSCSTCPTRSLNTLTVGQPLVGTRGRSQRPFALKSQYPHSWAASCWCSARAECSAQSPSQYPHSWAASCWKPKKGLREKSKMSLNTLTVGQPLVGQLSGKYERV